MTIKLLSLNLWHGQLIERCVEFLAGQDADIVLLQEVHNGTDSSLPIGYRSLEALQRGLNYPFYDFVPGLIFNHPEGMVPEGNLILSKFKIVGGDHVFINEGFNDNYEDKPENYPLYPRILQHVELETPAGQVNAYNLHGVWDLDGDNYSDRRKEMERKVIKAVDGKQNVLLGGDTNTRPTNQAIKNIENYLTSVFGDSLKSTFNMRHKTNPGYADSVVDMLFVSPDIKILDKGCPEADVSDHLPVWAELEITPRQSA